MLVNHRNTILFFIVLVFLSFSLTGFTSEDKQQLIKRKDNNALVINLQGAGITSFNMSKPYIYFDFDNDNFAERTGWISKKDAFLAVDKNNNSRIDNGNELFGNAQESGFEELNKYDDNKDFRIDSKDKVFYKILIWCDLNQDGLATKEELKNLAYYEIMSINLNKRKEFIEQGDNIITEVSNCKRKQHFNFYPWKSEYTIANITFKTDKIYTRYNGNYSLKVSTINLPWLRGYGRVPDLQLAISNDSNLEKTVLSIININNSKELYDKMDEFLAEWTNSKNIPISKKHGSVSLRELKVLYNFLGQNIEAPIPENEKINKERAYKILKDKTFTDLAAQSKIGKAFNIEYDYKKDLIITDENTYDKLVSNLTNENYYFASYIIADVLRKSRELEVEKLHKAIHKFGYGNELINYLNSGYRINDKGEQIYIKPLILLLKKN